MRFLSSIINGFALTGINLAAILVAFGIYYGVRGFLPGINQVVIQAPTAAFFSLAGYWLFNGLTKRVIPALAPQGRNAWLAVFFAAMAWTPVIFVPLHFVTQGYWTDFSNIAAIWLFQIPTNSITLGLVSLNTPASK